MTGHRLGGALAVALLLGIATTATAQPLSERLSYGSRAGMILTTVSKSGIGTADAVIRIEHRPEDARAFCVEYMQDDTPACVRATLAEVKVADRVSGNCAARNWTDMYGDDYAFLGPAQKSPESMADYAIRSLKTGEILDGSPASGYDVQLEIFRQLCPGIAK